MAEAKGFVPSEASGKRRATERYGLLKIPLVKTKVGTQKEEKQKAVHVAWTALFCDHKAWPTVVKGLRKRYSLRFLIRIRTQTGNHAKGVYIIKAYALYITNGLHHCESEYSLRLMICTFGDEIHAKAWWYAIAFAMDKKIRQVETCRIFWRKRRDSNPCTDCSVTAFRVRAVITTSIRFHVVFVYILSSRSTSQRLAFATLGWKPLRYASI